MQGVCASFLGKDKIVQAVEELESAGFSRAQIAVAGQTPHPEHSLETSIVAAMAGAAVTFGSAGNASYGLTVAAALDDPAEGEPEPHPTILAVTTDDPDAARQAQLILEAAGGDDIRLMD